MCLGSLGTVTRTWDAGGVPMAEYESTGRIATACLLYHPTVVTGDSVLVHMGFVVDVIDRETAAEAQELRTAMGQS